MASVNLHTNPVIAENSFHRFSDQKTEPFKTWINLNTPASCSSVKKSFVLFFCGANSIVSVRPQWEVSVSAGPLRLRCSLPLSGMYLSEHTHTHTHTHKLTAYARIYTYTSMQTRTHAEHTHLEGLLSWINNGHFRRMWGTQLEEQFHRSSESFSKEDRQEEKQYDEWWQQYISNCARNCVTTWNINTHTQG